MSTAPGSNKIRGLERDNPRRRSNLLVLFFDMGNKATTVKEEREEIFLKIVPPLDRAYERWLARDLQRAHGFTVKNPRAIAPPDSYIEYMRLNGLLDVDLDDPDLAHLFK